MEHFKYEMIAAGDWRRIDARETGNEPRPHLVPKTAGAMSFTAIVAFGAMGTGGLCPGEIRMGPADDDWMGAFRFIDLTPEAAVRIEADIVKEMERIMPVLDMVTVDALDAAGVDIVNGGPTDVKHCGVHKTVERRDE